MENIGLKKTEVYEFQLPDAYVRRLQTLGFCNDTGIYIGCNKARIVSVPEKEGTNTTFRLEVDAGTGTSDYTEAIRHALRTCQIGALTLLGKYMFGGDHRLSLDEQRRCLDFLTKFGKDAGVCLSPVTSIRNTVR